MPTKKTPKFFLKDRLFNPEKVNTLADEIQSVYSDFERNKFVHEVLERFGQLELKQRITHITDMLGKYLPSDYYEATEIISRALPPELDNTLRDGDFGDFIYAPYGEYIQRYGLSGKYLSHSFTLLEAITKRFSVEYPIRFFWNTYETETYEQFVRWSTNPSYHVRRLVSEGSRPRLPWGKNIGLDYRKTEIFLDTLYTDPTRYVTRSVANHLNDISKIDPEYVLQKITAWEQSGLQQPKEMEFIRKHATRTLRKKGL